MSTPSDVRLANTTALSGGDQLLDVFYRADDASLHHWQYAQGSWQFENMGGRLLSAPVGMALRPDSLHLFVTELDNDLNHGLYSRTSAEGFWEPEEIEVSWVSHDPVVLPITTDRYELFSASVEGALRHWSFSPGTRSHRADIVGVGAELGAVSRTPNLLDVFYPGDSGTLQRSTFSGLVTDDAQAWTAPVDMGGQLAGAPAVASFGPERLDIIGRQPDGRWVHWGWNGGRWFGPENNAAGQLACDPVAVTRVPEHVDVFARDTDGFPVHWRFNSGSQVWEGPERLGSDQILGCPSVVSWGPDRLDVFARSAAGPLLHWWSSDAVTWGSEQLDASLLPARPPPPGPRLPDAQFLLVRPDDLVILGVRFSGFQQQASRTGGGTELVSMDDNARLVLTFPPQHIGEQTWPAIGGPQDLSEGRLAGPSQLAFSVPAGTVVTPTAERVLDVCTALARSDGQWTPDDSAVELPWRLLSAPESRDSAAGVVSDHRSQPVATDVGAVGLWRSRLMAVGRADDGSDVGLALRPLDVELASHTDEFTAPLSVAERLTIAQQGDPAATQRLELSSLGGSLTVHQQWETFGWDHEAVLGRDEVVRTVQHGVLFPLGHRAQYERITRRVVDPGSGMPAELVTQQILTVTEPVRHAPSDPQAARAFPFSDVEITTLRFTDLEADWHTVDRTASDVEELEQELAQADYKMRTLKARIYGGDMGWQPGTPTAEDMAPGSSDAADYLSQIVTTDQLNAEIQAAEQHPATRPVPLYFWPLRQTGDESEPIRFPVRCQGAAGEVHFELPLVFYADVRFPRGSGYPAFTSLRDFSAQCEVIRAYESSLQGIVELPGVTVDLIGAATPAPGDLHEVHALHIAGVPDPVEDTFRPRLGTPDPDPYALPPAATTATETAAAQAWGVRVGMPALRTIMSDAPQPPAVLAQYAKDTALSYSKDYLAQGSDAVDAVLEVAGGTLPITFSGVADRSGGLVTPDLVADGISRKHGPVQLAGLTTSDPKDVLADGATLLGFDLRDVVSGLTGPPQILSDLTHTPPTTKMTWGDLTLQDKPPFKGGPQSTLELTVERSADSVTTTCDVTDFDLEMPPGAAALLTLHFEELKYSQVAGKAPDLAVNHVTAAFEGQLLLLQKLQEAVDLDKAGPDIRVTGTDIVASYQLPVPPVETGVFVMDGMVFRAAVLVPFDGRPVSVMLGFASREHPFTLSVLAFGGGGYVELEMDKSGLRRLEASLDFGAVVGVDFGVARGEVHAMGGVRYELADGEAKLSGFFRIGGTVEVLGLISVSVELVVTLAYDDTTNVLSGRATLVIDIDLTLYSDSVELDSGVWVLAGDPNAAHPAPPPLPPSRPVAGEPGGLRPPGGAFTEPPTQARAADAPNAEDADPASLAASWTAYRAAFAPTPTDALTDRRTP
ncbi:hypothetical protein OHB13_14250 [Streptomyces sp. NBC_00440]|uniref:hypothetical protein n=1 Tax=Streptomyces sp. NBC_00440 TaxID=2975741 RepID=UPI002E1AF5CC